MRLIESQPSPKAISMLRRACFKPECGVQHSDPAVVGRKSGSPEIVNADFCTRYTRQRSANVHKKTGLIASRFFILLRYCFAIYAISKHQ
jgi:hypothetical protein